MSILETLIVTSCVGVPSTYLDACNKALQAGTKQSGVEQSVDAAETKVGKKADNIAKEYVSENVAGVIGGAAFVAKSVSEKSATLNLPNMGICTTIKTTVGKDKSVLKLEWKF